MSEFVQGLAEATWDVARGDQEPVLVIAKALMVERTRCAKVARQWANKSPGNEATAEALYREIMM